MFPTLGICPLRKGSTKTQGHQDGGNQQVTQGSFHRKPPPCHKKNPEENGRVFRPGRFLHGRSNLNYSTARRSCQSPGQHRAQCLARLQENLYSANIALVNSRKPRYTIKAVRNTACGPCSAVIECLTTNQKVVGSNPAGLTKEAVAKLLLFAFIGQKTVVFDQMHDQISHFSALPSLLSNFLVFLKMPLGTIFATLLQRNFTVLQVVKMVVKK